MTDLIFVQSNSYEHTVVFSKIDNNARRELCKIQYDTKDEANKSLDKLMNEFNDYNKNILLNSEITRLEHKINEMYYLPDMPGYIKALNNYNSNINI
jgi:hypothetical protein